MIINHASEFPEDLKKRVKHTPAYVAHIASYERHRIDEVRTEIVNLLSPGKSIFDWEVAGILGQEMVRALELHLHSSETSLSGVFNSDVELKITDVKNSIIQGFKLLADNFKGIQPKDDIICRLRGRYDPSILVESGQSYQGLIYEHEPKNGRPPVIQDPKFVR